MTDPTALFAELAGDLSRIERSSPAPRRRRRRRRARRVRLDMSVVVKLRAAAGEVSWSHRLELGSPSPRWADRASCRRYRVDPARFYGNNPVDRRFARRLCSSCPVRLDCLRSQMVDEQCGRPDWRVVGNRGGFSPAARLRMYEMIRGRREASGTPVTVTR